MSEKLESETPVAAATTCSRALRPWTPEEVEHLRSWAGKIPAREIARRLGRTLASVNGKAHCKGWNLWTFGQRNPNAKYPDAAVECSRRLHEHGWSAGRISKTYGWPKAVVESWIYYRARRNDPVKLP